VDEPGEPIALFVYGTLTDPRVREQLLGRRADLEALRARLDDYARIAVPGFAYAYVVPAAGSSVDGIAILGLTDADYVALDEYEDTAIGLYERVQVQVELLGCGSAHACPAWVYTLPPGRVAPETGEQLAGAEPTD
jgi:gamma-glutamylcyclotransferase (GGCT)/AIG2-like uncharacterized protein YtfP